MSAEIQTCKETLDRHNAKLLATKQELAEVRTRRRDRFNELFDKFAAELPRIYRLLTSQAGTSSAAIGDPTEAPFDSQVILDFCPPGKRHGVDIEALSGGERSMAALSFLFALAAVVRPPLAILDEVDAYLDGENVEAISSYISRECGSMQSVIVSHKSELASKCDSLLGVCLLKDTASSKAFSLDLA